MNSTPDSGTVNASAVTKVGIEIRSGSKPRRIENTWIDYVRYGDGLVAYGTAWGIDDVYVEDSATGVNYDHKLRR